MLQIPGPLCSDEKAEKIITQYINDRLIALMADIMADFEEKGMAKNPEFASEIEFLFPENYEKEKQPKKFLKLYKLLKDEETFTAEPVMEYVLAQLLGLYEESGIAEDLPMPERAYVLEKLTEDFAADHSNYAEQDAAEYLEQLENPAEYMEVIFWDMDFALLEELKEEDLARNNPELAKNAKFGGES